MPITRANRSERISGVKDGAGIVAVAGSARTVDHAANRPPAGNPGRALKVSKPSSDPVVHRRVGAVTNAVNGGGVVQKDLQRLPHHCRRLMSP